MIVLCGKTASGKDTIAKKLIELGMKKLVTYTTRPMRKGEENGIDYWFFSERQFKTLEKEGIFLETTSYEVANGKTWYYGTPILGLDKDKVVIMNPDGVKEIVKHGEYSPLIFYLDVDEETIKERLKARGDNEDEAQRRLEADNKDFADIADYYYLKVDNSHTDPDTVALGIYNLYRESFVISVRRDENEE